MDHNAIVFIERAGETIPAGRLAIIEDGRYSRSEFSYGKKYLQRPDAVAIDPVQLPLTESKIHTKEDFTLFNGFRDASPDAWGRALIDIFMVRTEGRPASEAEFMLASQQGTRVGALQFGPTTDGPGRIIDAELPKISPDTGSLDAFQEMVDRFKNGESVSDSILDYVGPGTDLGGARPKSTVLIDNHPWMVKFGLKDDRIGMAASEAGCLDLCQMAGLEVCEHKIIDVMGRPAIALKRFDREKSPDGNLERKHMISGLTLLGAHEMDLGLNGYVDLYNGLRQYGAASDYGEEIYKRMVMNVLCGNTDDHYRNHAFMMNADGLYEPSPVYDVTPTTGFAGKRLFFHLGKAGSGREATLENAVMAAPGFGIGNERAVEITSDLADMVANNWRQVLSNRGASNDDLDLLEHSFSEAKTDISRSASFSIYNPFETRAPETGFVPSPET